MSDGKTEVTRTASSIAAARSELANLPGSPGFCASISCTVGYRNVDECVGRVSDWLEWHRHWVYGEEIPRSIPSEYPVRGRIVGVAEVDGHTPLYNDRKGDRRSTSSWEDESRAEFDAVIPPSDGERE